MEKTKVIEPQFKVYLSDYILESPTGRNPLVFRRRLQ